MSRPLVPPPSSYEKIDAVLLTVADELPRRPNWYSRLARLDRSAAAGSRLPVYQAVRDDGCLPEDAGFFLVSHTVEDVDRQNIKRQFSRRLVAHGEREMADLFKRHRDEFHHRHEKGRRFFFEPPELGAADLRAAVQELYDHVRQCVGSRLPMGALACRWSIDYGFVDLQVFPTPLELVGGPRDGAVVDPDIDFDLLRIQEAFDTIDGIGWTLDGDHREFHYVCFRGTYRGHDVWVSVFAGAPAGEKPTMKSDELRKWRAVRGDAAD